MLVETNWWLMQSCQGLQHSTMAHAMEPKHRCRHTPLPGGQGAGIRHDGGVNKAEQGRAMAMSACQMRHLQRLQHRQLYTQTWLQMTAGCIGAVLSWQACTQ